MLVSGWYSTSCHILICYRRFLSYYDKKDDNGVWYYVGVSCSKKDHKWCLMFLYLSTTRRAKTVSDVGAVGFCSIGFIKIIMVSDVVQKVPVPVLREGQRRYPM
jgi:hypothetical protein